MKKIFFSLAIASLPIFLQFSNANINNFDNSTLSVETSVSASRCQAITKSGTQCKRNAKAGSKYCWQHQK